MGEYLFWFYDVLFLLVFLRLVFSCGRKGFVAIAAGFAAMILGFVIASALSAPISNFIYDKFLRDGAKDYISGELSKLSNPNSLLDLKNVDMSQVVINGKTIDKLNLVPDEAGKVVIDLANADFSKTGLNDVDLSVFGIDNLKTDFSAMNFGKISLTASELSKNNVSGLILSKALSAVAKPGTGTGTGTGTGSDILLNISDKAAEYLPKFLGKSNLSGTDSLSSLVLSIVNSSAADVPGVILNNLVRPLAVGPIKSLVFALLFGIVTLILNFAVKALRLVNKIPLIGSLNVLLGACAGVLETLIVMFIFCAILRFIINFTGDSVILLNTPTINQTHAFKYIYNINLLNLFNK